MAKLDATARTRRSGPTVSSPSRIIRIDEVCARLSVSRSTVWRWEQNGLLPRSRRVGPNVSGWLESEVDEFIARTFGDDHSATDNGEGGEGAAASNGEPDNRRHR